MCSGWSQLAPQIRCSSGSGYKHSFDFRVRFVLFCLPFWVRPLEPETREIITLYWCAGLWKKVFLGSQKGTKVLFLGYPKSANNVIIIVNRTISVCEKWVERYLFLGSSGLLFGSRGVSFGTPFGTLCTLLGPSEPWDASGTLLGAFWGQLRVLSTSFWASRIT